jgi:hypothetical protein
MNLDAFALFIDPYLIPFFRITGYSLVDFFLGTFAVASMALLIGEFTVSLMFLAVRKRIDAVNQKMTHYQAMSIDALKVGDKEAYTASNKLANDAFGRSFFIQITMSAAFLWPIFFALEWMKMRFSEVEFELLFLDRTVGPVCVFIVLYVAAYLLFKRIKYRLPYFRNIKQILDSYDMDRSRADSRAS